jgi:competence protein ComEC
VKRLLEARDISREWRFAALAGATAGLAFAPIAPPDPAVTAVGAAPLAVLTLRALRPGGDAPTWQAPAWLALIALAAALAGLLLGGARLHAIDAGALRARPGLHASLTGSVAGVPRRDDGEVEMRVDTPRGRVLLIAPEPVAELPVGSKIRAAGVLGQPEPWRAGYLRRQGIAMTLRVDRIDRAPGRRTGLTGWIDDVRVRAERALGRGMPERQAALARGFVLGQDDRIDGATRENFRRSNLAHLLAVSGQNVILLGILAWPLLALIGLPVRARLMVILGLIAIYVPVTGAGPSIQRAGVMGAAGLVAALADRPRSRWYAVLLAACATLALNPRAEGDVGWQLSFAAVIGIMVWARRLASLMSRGVGRGSAWRALAEAVAVTVSATVATAPLMAAAFDQFSPAALPANILAAPAVAPAMWLGMLTGIVGQAPFLPVEPLNWLDSLCLAYIDQIAHWLAAPDWALLTAHLGSVWAVLAASVGLLLAMELLLRWLDRLASLRRDGRGFAKRSPQIWFPRAKRAGSLSGIPGRPAVILLVALLFIAAWQVRPSAEPQQTKGLVVRVLDVGQGDSIVLDPPGGDAVLVDTGPPGDGVEDRLRELGIDRLAAIVITHNQLDHAGGLGELLDSMDVGRVVYATAAPRIRGAALSAGAEPYRIAEGGGLDFGDLRLSALWPPSELGGRAEEDPNLFSVVLLARWRHFSMLLTGDAEAEAVPIDPGPVDVLKVSHHGSEDEGLDELLERSVPKLAVISVGAGNSFGHPAAGTLAELHSHGVPALRTDRHGEIALEADGSRWTAAPGAG